MSENVVAVRSIEIVTAEITMIRDNARKVFLESVIQIGTRLEEAKQMVPSGEWTAYLTDKLGYKPSTAQNYMRIARDYWPHVQAEARRIWREMRAAGFLDRQENPSP